MKVKQFSLHMNKLNYWRISTLHYPCPFQRSLSRCYCSQLQLYIGSYLYLIHQKEPSETIPKRSRVPLGFVMVPYTFIIFVNDLLDALEALALPFADDVKMANRTRAQKINLHKPRITI